MHSHLAAGSFLLLQNLQAVFAEVLKAVSSFPVPRKADTCNPSENQGGFFCLEINTIRKDASPSDVRKKKEKVLSIFLQLCSLTHTQEGPLVLMAIFRGLSWKPYDFDSSVAWGFLSSPSLIICLLCLQGNGQHKNLLTTKGTETHALCGAF